jgi:enediyne polyketide synthase
VLLAPAIVMAAKDIDLLVGVGPGRVLSGIAAEVVPEPMLSLRIRGGLPMRVHPA